MNALLRRVSLDHRRQLNSRNLPRNLTVSQAIQAERSLDIPTTAEAPEQATQRRQGMKITSDSFGRAAIDCMSNSIASPTPRSVSVNLRSSATERKDASRAPEISMQDVQQQQRQSSARSIGADQADLSNALRSGLRAFISKLYKSLSISIPEQATHVRPPSAAAPALVTAAPSSHARSADPSTFGNGTARPQSSLRRGRPAPTTAPITLDTTQTLRRDVELQLAHILQDAYDAPVITAYANESGPSQGQDVMRVLSKQPAYYRGLCSAAHEDPSELTEVRSRLARLSHRYIPLDALLDASALTKAADRLRAAAEQVKTKLPSSPSRSSWLTQTAILIQHASQAAERVKTTLHGIDALTGQSFSALAMQIAISKLRQQQDPTDAISTLAILLSAGADPLEPLNGLVQATGRTNMSGLALTDVDRLIREVIVWASPESIQNWLSGKLAPSRPTDRPTQPNAASGGAIFPTPSTVISSWTSATKVVLASPQDASQPSLEEETASQNPSASVAVSLVQQACSQLLASLSRRSTPGTQSEQLGQMLNTMTELLCALASSTQQGAPTIREGALTAQLTNVLYLLKRQLPVFTLHGTVAELPLPFTHQPALPRHLRDWYERWVLKTAKSHSAPIYQVNEEEVASGTQFLKDVEKYEELRYYVDLGALPREALIVANKQRQLAWSEIEKWSNLETLAGVVKPDSSDEDGFALSELVHIAQFASLVSSSTAETLPEQQAPTIVKLLQTRKIARPWSFWAYGLSNSVKSTIPPALLQRANELLAMILPSSRTAPVELLSELKSLNQTLRDYCASEERDRNMLSLHPVLPQQVPPAFLVRYLALLAGSDLSSSPFPQRPLYETLPHALRLSMLSTLTSLMSHPMNALTLAEARAPAFLAKSASDRISQTIRGPLAKSNLLNYFATTVLTDLRYSIGLWKHAKERCMRLRTPDNFRLAGLAQRELRRSIESASYVVCLIGVISFSLTIASPDESSIDLHTMGSTPMRQMQGRRPVHGSTDSDAELNELSEFDESSDEIDQLGTGSHSKSTGSFVRAHVRPSTAAPGSHDRLRQASTTGRRPLSAAPHAGASSKSLSANRWNLSRRMAAVRALMVEGSWLASEHEDATISIESRSTQRQSPLQPTPVLTLICLLNRLVTSAATRICLGLDKNLDESLQTADNSSTVAFENSPIAHYLASGELGLVQEDMEAMSSLRAQALLSEVRGRLLFTLRSTSPVMALVWIALHMDAPWIVTIESVTPFGGKLTSAHALTASLSLSRQLKSLIDFGDRVSERHTETQIALTTLMTQIQSRSFETDKECKAERSLHDTWHSLRRASEGDIGSLGSLSTWLSVVRRPPAGSESTPVLVSDPEVHVLAQSIKEAASRIRSRLLSLLPGFIVTWLERGGDDHSISPPEIRRLAVELERDSELQDRSRRDSLGISMALRDYRKRPSHRSLKVLRSAILGDLGIDADGNLLTDASHDDLSTDEKQLASALAHLRGIKRLEQLLCEPSHLSIRDYGAPDAEQNALNPESSSQGLSVSSPSQAVSPHASNANADDTSSLTSHETCSDSGSMDVLQEVAAEQQNLLKILDQLRSSDLSAGSETGELMERALALLNSEGAWAESQGPTNLRLALIATKILGSPTNSTYLETVTKSFQMLEFLNVLRRQFAAMSCEVSQRILFALQLVVSTLKIRLSERRYRLKAYRACLTGSMANFDKLRALRAKRLWITPQDLDSFSSAAETEKKLRAMVAEAARRARAIKIGGPKDSFGILSADAIASGAERRLPRSLVSSEDLEGVNVARRKRQLPKADLGAAGSGITLAQLLDSGSQYSEESSKDLDSSSDTADDSLHEDIAAAIFEDGADAPCPAWSVLLERGVLVELSAILALYARESLASTYQVQPLMDDLIKQTGEWLTNGMMPNQRRANSSLNIDPARLLLGSLQSSQGQNVSASQVPLTSPQLYNRVTTGRALVHASICMLLLSLQRGAPPHLAHLSLVRPRASADLASTVAEPACDSLSLAPIQLLALLRSDQCTDVPLSSALYSSSQFNLLYKALLRTNPMTKASHAAMARLGLQHRLPAFLPTREMTSFDISRWRHALILFPPTTDSNFGHRKGSAPTDIIEVLAGGHDHENVTPVLDLVEGTWHHFRTGQLHAKLHNLFEAENQTPQLADNSSPLGSMRPGKSLIVGALDHSLATAFARNSEKSDANRVGADVQRAQHTVASIFCASGSPLYQSVLTEQASWLHASTSIAIPAPDACVAATVTLSLVGVLGANHVWLQRILDDSALRRTSRNEGPSGQETELDAAPAGIGTRKQLFQRVLLDWLRTGISADFATTASLITNPLLGVATPSVRQPAAASIPTMISSFHSSTGIEIGDLKPDEALGLIESLPRVGANLATFRMLERLAVQRLDDLSSLPASNSISDASFWLCMTTQSYWSIARALQLSALRIVARPMASTEGLARLVSGPELLDSGHFDAALGLLGHPYPPIAQLALEVVAHTTVPRKTRLSVATTVTTTRYLSAPVPGIFYLAEAMFRHNAKAGGGNSRNSKNAQGSREAASDNIGEAERSNADGPDDARRAALSAFSKTTTTVSSTSSVITLFLDVDLERELGEELSLQLTEQEREIIHREAVKRELLLAELQKKKQQNDQDAAPDPAQSDESSPTITNSGTTLLVDIPTLGNDSSIDSNTVAASLRALIPASTLPKSYLSRVITHLTDERRPPTKSSTWLELKLQGLEQLLIGESKLDDVLEEASALIDEHRGLVHRAKTYDGILKALSPQLITSQFGCTDMTGSTAKNSSLLRLLRSTASSTAFAPFRVLDARATQTAVEGRHLLALALVLQASRALQSRLIFDRLIHATHRHGTQPSSERKANEVTGYATTNASFPHEDGGQRAAGSSRSCPNKTTLYLPWLEMFITAHAPYESIALGHSTRTIRGGLFTRSKGFGAPGLRNLLQHCFSYALFADHTSISRVSLKNNAQVQSRDWTKDGTGSPSGSKLLCSALPFVELANTPRTLDSLHEMLASHSFPLTWEASSSEPRTRLQTELRSFDLLRSEYAHELSKSFGRFDGSREDSRVLAALRILFHLCHTPQGYDSIRKFAGLQPHNGELEAPMAWLASTPDSSIATVLKAFHDLRRKQKVQRMNLRLDLALQEAQHKLVHGRATGTELDNSALASQLVSAEWSGSSKDDTTVSTSRVFSFNLPPDNEVPLSVVYGTTSGLSKLDVVNSGGQAQTIASLLNAKSNDTVKLPSTLNGVPRYSETLADIIRSRRLRMTPAAEATVLRTIEIFRREEEREARLRSPELQAHNAPNPAQAQRGSPGEQSEKRRNTKSQPSDVPRPSTGDYDSSVQTERFVPTPAYGVGWPPVPGVDSAPHHRLFTSGFIPRRPLEDSASKASSRLLSELEPTDLGSVTKSADVWRAGATTIPVTTNLALERELDDTKQAAPVQWRPNLMDYEDDIELWSDSDEDEVPVKGSERPPWRSGGSLSAADRPRRTKITDPRVAKMRNRPKMIREALKYDTQKLAEATANAIRENELLLGKAAQVQLRRESRAVDDYLRSLFEDDVGSGDEDDGSVTRESEFSPSTPQADSPTVNAFHASAMSNELPVRSPRLVQSKARAAGSVKLSHHNKK